MEDKESGIQFMEGVNARDDSFYAHQTPVKLTPGSEPLPNIRHERFCQIRAAGEQQTRAYIQAGYKDSEPARHNASTLASKDDIKDRIRWICARMADKQVDRASTVTRDTLTAEADAALEVAIELKHTSAVASLLTFKAKLRGLLTDKVVTEEDAPELTAEEEAYHREYAAWRLAQGMDIRTRAYNEQCAKLGAGTATRAEQRSSSGLTPCGGPKGVSKRDSGSESNVVPIQGKEGGAETPKGAGVAI